MLWQKSTQDKFDQMIEKIPVFLRGVAKEKVAKRAENFAGQGNRHEVNDKDMVDAFFKETPFGFHGPLKTDMEDLGIDYTQYGHEK